MPLAALWETWRSPAKETVQSFTIVTTEPNDLCGNLHNRMPVVLPADACSLARRATCRAETVAIPADPLPGRGDVLAGKPARRQRYKQRSDTDRASRRAIAY